MDRGSGPARRSAYVLPRHPSEVDRLDVLHFATSAALGHHHLAPVEQPDRVLDVGAGTGQWAYELCAELPGALVVGYDLAASKPNAPPNYAPVRGNLLQGLPFPDGAFDYVHQRLLISGVPVREWRPVVADLVRVTRPGGWIELVESMPGMEPEGPATRRLYDLLRQLGRSAGLDTLGHVFGSLERYLVLAGVESTQDRILPLPIGEWAGSVGSWMACEYRALFTRLAGIFQASYGLPEAECLRLVVAMLGEFEQLQPTVSYRYAFGRRPAGAAAS
jgi:SAM-dependent methyltransferase